MPSHTSKPSSRISSHPLSLWLHCALLVCSNLAICDLRIFHALYGYGNRKELRLALQRMLVQALRRHDGGARNLQVYSVGKQHARSLAAGHCMCMLHDIFKQFVYCPPCPSDKVMLVPEPFGNPWPPAPALTPQHQSPIYPCGIPPGCFLKFQPLLTTNRTSHPQCTPLIYHQILGDQIFYRQVFAVP